MMEIEYLLAHKTQNLIQHPLTESMAQIYIQAGPLQHVPHHHSDLGVVPRYIGNNTQPILQA